MHVYCSTNTNMNININSRFILSSSHKTPLMLSLLYRTGLSSLFLALGDAWIGVEMGVYLEFINTTCG
jgi:hypothetical protein